MLKRAFFISFLLIGISISILILLKNNSILGVNTKSEYTLVFIGDSMTEYLGNFDELKNLLKESYPNKSFLLLNYGFGSTNILSVLERVEKESSHSGRTFKPVNEIDFDIVFVESFGHNPLSHLPLKEGLKLQEETLDKIVSVLRYKHPQAKIVFIATIAPNKDRYAEGAVVLETEQRQKWADERSEYIKNHIKYAKEKGIPLINIYEASLKDGTGNIDYINSNDFIHPSPTGIYFISEQIARFIKKERLVN